MLTPCGFSLVGPPAPPRARPRRAALLQVASQYRLRRPLPCWGGSWRPQASHRPGSSTSATACPIALLRAQLPLARNYNRVAGAARKTRVSGWLLWPAERRNAGEEQGQRQTHDHGPPPAPRAAPGRLRPEGDRGGDDGRGEQ